MNKMFAFIFILFGVMAVSSCKPVSMEQQRAAATAYVQAGLTEGQKSAEQSALTLCNVDLEKGKEDYEAKVCRQATVLGCQFIVDQIDEIHFHKAIEALNTHINETE